MYRPRAGTVVGAHENSMEASRKVTTCVYLELPVGNAQSACSATACSRPSAARCSGPELGGRVLPYCQTRRKGPAVQRRLPQSDLRKKCPRNLCAKRHIARRRAPTYAHDVSRLPGCSRKHSPKLSGTSSSKSSTPWRHATASNNNLPVDAKRSGILARRRAQNGFQVRARRRRRIHLARATAWDVLPFP